MYFFFPLSPFSLPCFSLVNKSFKKEARYKGLTPKGLLLNKGLTPGLIPVGTQNCVGSFTQEVSKDYSFPEGNGTAHEENILLG